MSLNYKIINHNSSEYLQAVDLRHKLLRKPLNLNFTKEELENENNQIHFVCFENKIIIASLTLVLKERNQVKMRQVCVAEKFQKKGIGKKLIIFSEKWAKENNNKSIYCHARKNALNFYSSLGYSIQGDAFMEVGLEHYKLIKKLS